jgi:crotonobetainyl-CoA:carnitine CoA-transferase CaiB-like acyl-CoA transferase
MVLEAPVAVAARPARGRLPVHLGRAGEIRIAPPRLGQHTGAVLAELGLTEAGAA